MRRLPRWSLLTAAALVCLLGLIPVARSQSGAKNGEWTSWGGDLGNTHYSPLDQINASNFNKLEVAWRFKPDSLGPQPEYQYEGTPLVVKGRLYITAGSRRAVVCLDPATGEMLWMHSENEGKRGELAPRGLSGHGVAYWTDGKEERILYITPGYRLIALDAKTGYPVKTFGINGVVDLRLNDDQQMDLVTADIGLHSTPAVAKDVVIVGAAHAAGTVPKSKGNVKGYVRGFDVRTGKRLWIFHTIPRPGEFGLDTWEKDSWAYTGNAGVWGQISVDEDLNMVYLPVELPTGDFYGGHRPGNALFGETLLAVDLHTGKRIWHYQLVHHGLWDMDIPCAPMLVDLNIDGKIVKAVAQPTKQEYLYVFDRQTGKPIWPIVETPVPQGDVPGEWYSKTQPIPTKPPAYGHQGVKLDDLIDFTPELHKEAVELVSKYKIGPLFTPPVVSNADGPIATIVSPGNQGGTNWPGGAFDPETHLLYVFAEITIGIDGLVKPPPEMSDMNYVGGRAGAAPTRGRGMGMGAPRPTGGEGGGRGLTVQGLPLLKPPYGVLSAIDLNKGDIAWQIAHGGTPDNVRNSPVLKGLNIPRTGRPGLLGPLVTKSLVIMGEAGVVTTESGARGAMLRAYDKATGKEVGAIYMEAPQSGSPMTYMLDGQQYLAIAISGGNYSAELVAYKLPSASDAAPATTTQVQPPPAAIAPQAAPQAGGPIYTAAQAARGQTLYTQRCAVCHGPGLEGIEMAPSLAGGDFMDRWSGQSIGALFERTRATMPKDRPGSLSRDANADIIAYILSVNKFAPGQRELPGDAQTLNQIKFDAVKPKP
jgi:quinoprotein glucose dehydrogenase